MHAGLFITLETESRFDVSAHLADLTAQVRTARDAGFGSLWFPQHFVTGPTMRQFAAAPIMGYLANLSGGNRQKVMLARGLTRDFAVYLFDEPTVGIDVGAKVEVYEFMKSLAEGGAAVVLVSSELPEVLHLSARVYVMHLGRIVAELTGGDITEQNVLARFFPHTATASVP